jgi:hypothetical protein
VSNELVGGERHDLGAIAAVGAVVLPLECARVTDLAANPAVLRSALRNAQFGNSGDKIGQAVRRTHPMLVHT